MITLEPDRVGPYIRALRAGVRALAPDIRHVSAAALDTQLQGLDPAVSASLFLPARVDPRSGLPALAWMDRVRAERDASRQVRPTDPRRVAAIAHTDPDLAERLTGRIRLSEILGDRPLVPELAVTAHVVRRGESRRSAAKQVRVVLDRRIPGVGWTRIRLDVDTSADDVPDVFGSGPERSVPVKPGFAELLSRHAISPLGGLLAVLVDVVGLRVHALSRGVMGPFWFPGGPVLDGMPAWADGALVLHSTIEVMGGGVRTMSNHDPFAQGWVDRPAEGGCFRGRRMAVSPHRVEAARAWAAARVGVADVVPLTP